MQDLLNESVIALELPSVLDEVAGHAGSMPGKLQVLNSVSRDRHSNH